VGLEAVNHSGIDRIQPRHVQAAEQLDMVVRLVGAATLEGGAVDVRVHPAFIDRGHPLASVEGPFNAVMLQGDAIREITLAGPGAGGVETASAVIADMVSVIGTTGTGFLQNDASWRTLETLPPGDLRSPFYVHIEVADRPGVLAHVAERFGGQGVSIARLTQNLLNGSAALDLVTHDAPAGRVDAALDEIASLDEVLRPPDVFPVVHDRGV
jgi:homoserine dehydrogenase